MQKNRTGAARQGIATPGVEQRKSAELDELDLGMVGAMHAFQRWIVSAMRDAGLKNLGVIDALVLDQLKQRAHNKRLVDICFIMNIEDAHVVAYSLRKLMGLGLVRTNKRGKEVTYSVTHSGLEHLLRYREIYECRLLDGLLALRLNKPVLGELAQYLRKMSGHYDQAARAATSF